MEETVDYESGLYSVPVLGVIRGQKSCETGDLNGKGNGQ